MLAAVKLKTPAAPLVSVVDAPEIKPTVPVVMGFKVTACVASMLNAVISSALTLTVVNAVAPPPTAPAKLTSPVPAVTVKALAAVVDVNEPATVTLAPPVSALFNKNALPEPASTTLPP